MTQMAELTRIQAKGREEVFVFSRLQILAG
jgi:hypothetical protein